MHFKNTIIKTRYKLLYFLMQYPFLYFTITKHKHLIVRPNTDIVIEGYPRSANSFAVYAFQIAQKENRDNIKIAHHLHAPAQIIKAVKYDIPTLVLIRDPENAVLSLVTKNNNITFKMALNYYIRFYSKIFPYKNKFYVALFDDVINDFGKVIKGLNEYFNTNFRLFEHTKENVDRCYAIMRQRAKKIYNDDELKLSIPDGKKEQRKKDLRNELYSDKNKKLLNKANTIYKIYKEELSK